MYPKWPLYKDLRSVISMHSIGTAATKTFMVSCSSNEEEYRDALLSSGLEIF